MGLLPNAEAHGNFVRDAWDRLQGLPGGSRIFSRAIGLAAPYTGNIRAHVVELRPGFARVEMRDRPALRNHLRSVHAVALANLAELTGNVALAYSLPDDGRFIVAGMDLKYVKKARGTITGTSDCPVPSSSEKADFDVPVVLRDSDGNIVVEAVLHSRVGPKKPAA